MLKIAQKHSVVIVFLSLAMVVGGYLLTRNIDQHWNGIDAHDGALFSAIANNYLTYGVIDLSGGQARNFEAVQDISGLTYYQHHPPMLPLITAVSFKLFGENEWSARLVPIFFTLITAILLFDLTKKLYGGKEAAVASFVFLTFPAVLIFGRKPGYEAIALFFVVLLVWAYLNYRESRAQRHLVLVFLAAGLGSLADWPVYFAVLGIIAHNFIFSQKKLEKKIVLGLPAVSGLALLFFIFQSYSADPQTVTSLFYQGLAYSGLIDSSTAASLGYVPASEMALTTESVRRVVNWIELSFGFPLIVLSLAGGYLVSRSANVTKWPVLLFLLVAALNCFVFWKSFLMHIWWTYYFAIPFSILSALAIVRLAEQVKIQNMAPGVNLWTPAVVYTTFVSIVVSTMLPSLLALHGRQQMLIENRQHEAADFIAQVGHKLKGLTNKEDVLLTNLTSEPAVTHILPYYASRKVVKVGAGAESALDLVESRNMSKSPYYFLIERDGVGVASISRNMESPGIIEPLPPFEVDGVEFQVFLRHR